MVNAKVSDFVGVMSAIDPDAYTAAAYTSPYVLARRADQFMAVIMAGTLGASATLDAKIVQATDSSGTGVKDVTGKAITQLTQAGSDSDKQAVITLKPGDLDTENDFVYFAVVMTVGTATSDAGAVIIGVNGRDMPITDATTVDEIV